MAVSLTVNGERVSRTVPVRQHLVDFLRSELGLTGAHLGCEHGICGACSVRVDGVVVRGCLMLAVQVDGAAVVTIEGLADTGEIADLQEAFVERNALQCGYCTPGMLMTAAELLEQATPRSREEIRTFLSGNYCRCTGYHAIVDAVETTLMKRLKRGSEPSVMIEKSVSSL
jgi:aerobic carbon-monoxide dehydrogenase small subunit